MPYRARTFDDFQNEIDNTFIIKDYKINTDSSVPIPGMYVQNYAPVIADAFRWQLENFTSDNIPTDNAQPNQLWYNYGEKSLMVYVGNNDSSNIDEWVAIDANIKALLLDHTSRVSPENVHQTTLTQLDLEKVDNVKVFDKNKVFSEYQEGVLDINLPTAHTNLGVYSKSVLFTKDEANERYLYASDVSDDTSLFDDQNSDDLVFIASPRITAGIIVDNPDSDFIRATDDTSSISFSTNVDSMITSGVTSDLITAQDNYSGVTISQHSTDTDNPKWSVNLYDRGSKGSAPLNTGTLEFNKDNLYINGAGTYHAGSPPTPVDIGALELGGTADDTSLLGGSVESTSATANTIVERDTSGDIAANSIYSTTSEANESIATGSTLLFKHTDNKIYTATKDQINSWVDSNSLINIHDAKAWIVFNAALTSVNSYNATVYRSASGRFGVNFSSAARPPNTNYCAVLGMVDNGNVSSGAAVSAWIASRSTTGVSVRSKHTLWSKKYHYDDDPDSWYPQWATPYVDGLLYTLAIYY